MQYPTPDIEIDPSRCIHYPHDTNNIFPACGSLPHSLLMFKMSRKPRHGVNAISQLIIAFILNLAMRWEFQPDSEQIHMAFPTKVVSRTVRMKNNSSKYWKQYFSTESQSRLPE